MRLLSFTLLSFLALITKAQSIHFSEKREAPLFVLSSGFLASSYVLHRQNKAPHPSQVRYLNPDGIPAFDRIAIYQNSSSAKHISDVGLYGSIIGPMCLATVDPKMRPQVRLKIAVMAAETWILTSGLTQLTKEISRRPRPYMYNANVPIAQKLDKDAMQSFYSGHSSLSAAMCFFTAQSYSLLYPESKWKPYVWTACIVWPAVTAAMRVKAGKHFPTDVITGYVIGAGIGILVPRMHIRSNKNLRKGPVYINQINEISH